jgi:hypothetical protein
VLHVPELHYHRNNRPWKKGVKGRLRIKKEIRREDTEGEKLYEAGMDRSLAYTVNHNILSAEDFLWFESRYKKSNHYGMICSPVFSNFSKTRSAVVSSILTNQPDSERDKIRGLNIGFNSCMHKTPWSNLFRVLQRSTLRVERNVLWLLLCHMQSINSRQVTRLVHGMLIPSVPRGFLKIVP